MEETIHKLQKYILEDESLSEEEKKNHAVRLEAMKSFKNNDPLKRSLETLLKEIENNKGAIKKFFADLDKVFSTYLEEGIDGVERILEEEIKKSK